MSRRHRRSNPDFKIFGEDVEDRAINAVGLALTSWVNKNVARPLADKAFTLTGIAGKLLDAGTTAVSALGVGEIVSLVNRRVGRDLRTGGFVLVGAKLIATPVPGFSVDATLPAWFDKLRPPFAGALTPAAAAALPAGTVARLAVPPGGQPDYPAADPNSDIGL